MEAIELFKYYGNKIGQSTINLANKVKEKVTDPEF